MLDRKVDPSSIKEEPIEETTAPNFAAENDEKEKLIEEIVELKQQQQRSFFELQEKNKQISQLEGRVAMLEEKIKAIQVENDVFEVACIKDHKKVGKAIHFCIGKAMASIKIHGNRGTFVQMFQHLLKMHFSECLLIVDVVCLRWTYLFIMEFCLLLNI